MFAIPVSYNKAATLYTVQLDVCEAIKDYSTLGVHYRDLQARVHEQETRNLTLYEAQPSAVLNFEFLVRERVRLRLERRS